LNCFAFGSPSEIIYFIYVVTPSLLTGKSTISLLKFKIIAFMVLTRSSSKKEASTPYEEKQDYSETPVRRLTRELVSLGIRAPPGTPRPQSSPEVEELQVPTTDQVLNQVGDKCAGIDERQSISSDSDEGFLESSPVAPDNNKTNVQATESVASDTFSKDEETSPKESIHSWKPTSPVLQKTEDGTGQREEDGKSLQVVEAQQHDSCSATPIHQPIEADFQLVGNEASNEWRGEHIRFSVLGKSKVKVHHEPGIKTFSPSDEQGEDLSITEDDSQGMTPEPQKLHFDFDENSLLELNNDDATLSKEQVTSETPNETHFEANVHLRSSESSKKKGQFTPRRYLFENSHFSMHTQSSAAKDKKLASLVDLQRDKENIDKSGNSVRWKGHHIRFEESPDTIGEKMKNLHIEDARFMKPTVSASAKRSEPKSRQEFASKYLWKF